MEQRFMNKPWFTAPSQLNDSQLMNLILTGAKSRESFKPSENALEQVAPPDKKVSVLDFGCGMGRNLKWMMEKTSWVVTGYDSSPMLDRAKKWLSSGSKRPIPTLVSGWEPLKPKKFDVVLAALVFQHIYNPELSEYLADLSRMTKTLVILGRRVNDDGSNTIETVHKFFDLKQIIRATPMKMSLQGPPYGHNVCIGTSRA